MASCGKHCLTRATLENKQIFKPDKQLEWGRIHRFCSCNRLLNVLRNEETLMGVPAIVQISPLGPPRSKVLIWTHTACGFGQNIRRETGSGETVPWLLLLSSILLSAPPSSFPILAGGQWRDVAAKWPNHASRHKQLTHRGKGLYQRILSARQQESVLEVGEWVVWGGDRGVGDKEDRVRGRRGELFISGTLFQFHLGMMEIFRGAKPRVEGVW